MNQFNLKNKHYQITIEPITKNSNSLYADAQYLLTKREQEAYQNFSSERRKQEWLLTRILLKKILGNSYSPISYQNSGKPTISGYHISISHTHGAVALILSEQNNVGIDVELISDKISRIKNKFLLPHEIENLKGNIPLYLTLIWSAKEVLYKLYSKGGIDFKENLKIESFKLAQKGNFDAEIILPNFTEKYKMQYQLLGDKNEFAAIWGILKAKDND